MNNKLVKEFLAITFAIMIICWGGCVILTQVGNLTINNIFILILRFVGGFSPTIASYISLKRYNIINSFKEWFKTIFKVRNKISVYLIVFILAFTQFLLLCLTSVYKIGAPIYYLFWLVPIMFLMGGNEEIGWRMILQPELEKKYNYYTATIITFIIWWFWHFPLFYIIGDSHVGQNFILFGIGCLCESFALSSIRKISKEVFPCILFHCLTNSLYNIFIIENSLIGNKITTGVIVILSIIIVKKYENNKKNKEEVYI